MRVITVEAARRIALGAQGFTDTAPRGRVDARHFRRVMRRMGLVQLDSVNVCLRTHYLPFYARLGPYDRDHLDRWLNDSGENFEYWAHEAAVLPVDRHPLWRWKMDTMKPWRRTEALMREHPGVIESVLDQVREDGPLTVRDLDAPNHRNEPWWGYGPGKVALEHLFARGDITAVRTDNFTRLYDMPERRIPASVINADAMDKGTAYRVLLRDALRHHGIGTLHDIADYYRLHIPTARPVLAAMAEAGEIEPVSVPGWPSPTYLDPDAVRPRAVRGATLVSPFDPVVWYRERAERLFGFRYRIEIYVPEPQRVHGYYVLPFMLDGELVARVDLKADRAASNLLVQSSFVESEGRASQVADALAAELERFAG
ncbi:winged helix-turn-helix domain-containing protein, partial [Actinomycetota bacterium]